MTILFPQQPFARGRVEPDFADEFQAAAAAGFGTELYDHDALLAGETVAATASLRPSSSTIPTLLRGWMLPGETYGVLHDLLHAKGYRLETTRAAYEEAHYFPFAYPLLEGHCARAAWTEGDDPEAAWQLYRREFCHADCLIKDWVKSAKTKWKDACFLPRETTSERFREIFANFRAERGSLFNRGVVFREFMPIVETGRDLRGQPLVEEVRLFFWRGSILVSPLGRVPSPMAERARWEDLAGRFASPFVTIDVAYLTDGTWRVVEVGDGGVSGLPVGLGAEEFYPSLRKAVGASWQRS